MTWTREKQIARTEYLICTPLLQPASCIVLRDETAGACCLPMSLVEEILDRWS